SGVRNQFVEQLVFGWAELHVPAVGRDAPLGEVDREVPEVEDRLVFLGDRHVGAPQDGLDPGDELRHTEGLGQVVVSAELEAADLVDLFTLGGENDDGNGRELAQAAADLESV